AGAPWPRREPHAAPPRPPPARTPRRPATPLRVHARSRAAGTPGAPGRCYAGWVGRDSETKGTAGALHAADTPGHGSRQYRQLVRRDTNDPAEHRRVSPSRGKKSWGNATTPSSAWPAPWG